MNPTKIFIQVAFILTILCLIAIKFADKKIDTNIQRLLNADQEKLVRSHSKYDGFARIYLREVANYQEEYFKKNNKYFKCKNRACLPSFNDDYTYFGLGAKVEVVDDNFIAEVRHSSNDRPYFWDKRKGGLQLNAENIKDPYDPYETMLPDEIAKEVLKDLTYSEMAYFINHTVYLSCKNTECGKKLSRYRFVPDSVEVEMIADGNTFRGSAKHKSSQNYFYTNQDEKLKNNKHSKGKQ